MSRIIEKYCGFHRNETLLKRHDSFCLNKNLVLCYKDHNRCVLVIG
ncbi:hypothetical protein ACR9KH_03715 [Helicobacter pylori]